MAVGFLLSRVLLEFDNTSKDLCQHLSAVALTPEGNLWVGSDEFTTLERLSPLQAYIFGDHRPYQVGDFVQLTNHKDEIDIEGMDYADGYLWFTGSHGTKRKKTKGKNPTKDIERLETIQHEHNRYMLARIPVLGGDLVKSGSPPKQPEKERHAASLQATDGGNLLTRALRDDDHLGPFLSFPLPGKENGFDIEGLAIHGKRIFLGLRGPVLRGWAMLLEIAVEEHEAGVLTLQAIGPQKTLYKKHFLDLNGLGVRDLCFQGNDLLILAGPTMQLEGAMRVFRLHNVMKHEGDSLVDQDTEELEVVFDLPFIIGSDHAEGMALFSCLGYPEALLIVYDAPDATRQVKPHKVFADVFRLP